MGNNGLMQRGVVKAKRLSIAHNWFIDLRSSGNRAGGGPAANSGVDGTAARVLGREFVPN